MGTGHVYAYTGENRSNTGVFSRVTTAEKTGFYIAYVVSIDLKPPVRVTLEAVCRMVYGNKEPNCRSFRGIY